MRVKINIIFYSMYGHVYQMAEAVAKGVRDVQDVDVNLYRVKELMPDDVLEKSGAKEAQAKFAHIPEADVGVLAEADGLIFGTPTRFGNMSAQMRNFLDQAGGLWAQDKLVNKIGSVFISTGSQHGGQETTITSFHTTLFHLGMVVVGVPYSEKRLLTMDEISGGTPYGASTLAGKGERQPSENELAIARSQGKHVATITAALKKGLSA